MSADDYFDDDSFSPAGIAEEDAGEGGEDAAPEGLRGWLNRKRGWVLIIGLAVIQAIFASVMIMLRTAPDSTPEARVQEIRKLATEMLGYEVGIKDIYQFIPASGGRRLSLGMEMVLVLGQLPEERVEGAPRPTSEEFEVFIAAIQAMEPNIRSRLNILIQGVPPDDLANPEVNLMLKKEIGNYVNDTLAGLNFSGKVRPGIGKRRVTEVLIPMFLVQAGRR